MKILHFDRKHQHQIEDWLQENIGAQGFRWWTESVMPIYDADNINKGPDYSQSLRVTLDLTKEESSMLSLFLLSCPP
jgi:hypothetical protein